MEFNTTKPEIKVGEMRLSREPMADGKRYIIYYTFGEQTGKQSETFSTGEQPAAENTVKNAAKNAGGDGK